MVSDLLLQIKIGQHIKVSSGQSIDFSQSLSPVDVVGGKIWVKDVVSKTRP